MSGLPGPKKAFDTVDHTILIQKLYKYCFSVNATEWFRNYLSNIKHLIKIISSMKDVLCGVPQGSILGPLLFISYINDIIEYLMGSRINPYVDDTAFYYSSDNIIDVMNTLKSEMVLVGEWLRANKLTLNIAKTKFVIFG